MVQIEGPPDHERLDEIVHRVAAAHELVLDTTGWSHTTYDVYRVKSRLGSRLRVARLDSFATTSGEIQVFDDEGLPFAQAIGAELEQAFKIGEAVIRRL